jgi:hypothetical protein
MLIYHKMSLNPSSASAPAPATCAAVGMSFSGKTVFGASAKAGAYTGNDAINLLTTGRPVQPAAKLLDNWFNGNSTGVNANNRPKAAMSPVVGDSRMVRSFVAM